VLFRSYEYELLRNLSRNFVNARYALPLFVIAVAGIAHFWIGYFIAALWAIITGLCYLLLSTTGSRFLREVKSEADMGDRRNHFMIAQLMVAVCWGFFALYDCLACGDNQYGTIQFSAILVFQAVTTMITYAFGVGVLIVGAPASIILAIRFFLTYDPVFMVMGGIICGSLIFFYLIAERFKLSVHAMLESGAERDALIAELETAKSMSEGARARAEEANLAKSRFLATMSHELRTPLNAILGFSEVMRDEVLGPIGVEAYKDYLNDIHNSGSHLLNVINEILDLSRIEAGKQELNEEAVKLAHIVEDATRMIDVRAKTKDISINTFFEEGLPQLWADEKALRQITLNLLSNALKFTPNGGHIDIKVGWTRMGGQYLSISDTGPGISEEEIPIVLSTFGQGSIAIKSAEQGSGLGLPIVQALVNMHNGKFELKSKLREGTEVIAIFPKSRVLEVLPAMKNFDTIPSAKPRKSLMAALT